MTNPNDQSLENVKTPERAEPGDEAEVSLYENEAVDRPPRFRNSQDVLAYVKKSMTERGYSRSEEVIAEILKGQAEEDRIAMDETDVLDNIG